MLEIVLPHPLLVLFSGPVASKAQLEESVTRDSSGLNESPHHRSVTGEVSFNFVGGVGVSVEMNHGHVAKTVGFRHSCRTRPSDRVIAAENHRDNAAGGECAHALINTRFRFLPLAMARDGVTKVDDVEVIEDFDAEIEMIGARVIRIRAKCPGSKTRAGSIGRAVIPRGTHHRDIGLDGVEIFRISNKGAHSEGGETLEGRCVELLTHARSNEIVCSHLPRVGLESPDLKGVWTFCSRPNHGCPRGGVLGAN